MKRQRKQSSALENIEGSCADGSLPRATRIPKRRPGTFSYRFVVKGCETVSVGTTLAQQNHSLERTKAPICARRRPKADIATRGGLDLLAGLLQNCRRDRYL